MATWYADYEAGSLNNSGDSFAVTLALTDLVATGTTTVTSVTGGFTGLATRRIFIVGVGGRTISSVTDNNTAVLNASVPAGTYSANVGGRRTTMDSFTTTNCQGYAAGDTVRMKSSPAPTSLSAVGNWADCSPTVVLMGGSGTVIADCETAWTASANVTATADATIFKVGSKSAKIDVAAGFSTGLAAYFPTGSLNLSANQILSFWFRQSAGTNIVAGDITIRLCSDTAGVSTVNTLSCPALPVGGSAAGAKDVWVPMAVDLGSAMGASIQSIAIYIAVDRGASTYYFDDFKVWTAPNLTKSIDNCDSGWTASSNVTILNATSRKEGTFGRDIAVASGFTTGMAAYGTISAVDLSAYTQVSFVLRQSAGTLLATGGATLRLCSDTAGVTTVNSIAIPALTGSSTHLWHRIVVDTGGSLGASIQSVAFDINVDVGAMTFQLDNIIACKDSTSADAITHQSLIGRPNSTGAGGTDADTWYCIRSIVNNTITLETGPNSSAATASRGYYGGTVNPPAFDTCYKRETTKTAYVGSGSTAVQSPQISGSAGSPVTWSGGWNSTDMSTQTGETWFDGRNGLGNGIYTGSQTYLTLSKIGCVRYTVGVYTDNGASSDITLQAVHTNCCTTGIYLYTRWSLVSMWACNNSAHGVASGFSTYNNVTGDNIVGHNNIGSGVSLDGLFSVMEDINCCNNGTYGCYFGQNSTTGGGQESNSSYRNVTTDQNFGGVVYGGATGEIHTLVSTGNASTGVSLQPKSNGLRIYSATLANNASSSLTASTALAGQCYLFNSTFGDATEVGSVMSWSDYKILSTRHDATDNNHWGFTDGGTFNSQVSVRRTASGIAWQMNPTSTNRSATYPLRMSLGAYTVPAALCTIKCWLRRTNTGLTMKLVCPGGRLPGVVSDVSSAMTASADTWEEITITFTPTSAGVIELEVWCYGGTTYTGYVDDLTVNGVAIPLDQGWQGRPFQDAVASPSGTRTYASVG